MASEGHVCPLIWRGATKRDQYFLSSVENTHWVAKWGRSEMLFIVQFEDKPGVADRRQALLASHVEFLDRVKDHVLVPGSMREIETDRPLGGLWIVDAGDEVEVRDIFKDDPFWKNGLRASVRINRWQKAFPDRKVPV
jgi:hypothetical protein